MIVNGWLLDVYPTPGTGVVIWLLTEDGERCRLTRPFPLTFYATGENRRLRSLWQYLKNQPVMLNLSRSQKQDIFQPEPLTVLAVEVLDPSEHSRIFAQTQQEFPDLSYYNADIPIPLRFSAATDTFPLCYCQVTIQENGFASSIIPADSPWDLDPPQPPLRILTMELDVDPRHNTPQTLTLRYGGHRCQFNMKPERPMLVNLAAILRQYDPDLLLTTWGDSWLLPHLLELGQQWNIDLPLNRDCQKEVAHRDERSYFSYGQVIHRDQQTLLFGRCHIDAYNAVLFHDYGLEGVYEIARVTGLPLQTAARVSPGTGISSMQINTALHDDILVPWHKQQGEQPKTADQLLRTDQGGLVYQPIPGLHRNVAELDFVSMYPSIMVHCNISPETNSNALNVAPSNTPPGLIPRTLDPLLNKRLALKRQLVELPSWDERRRAYKAQVSAHKWLLVTCFGYLGYKNARFGRIEAHEAVTTYGREALLCAKDTAEDMGFTVLHMYVDGMWIWRENSSNTRDYDLLLHEITRRTGLPIALDGIYHWVAFLPSKLDRRVPCANRYFGIFQDGSLKIRGIEARRRDTPIWIAETQMEILKLMSKIKNPDRLSECLPPILSLLRKEIRRLRSGKIPLEKLVLSQKLSRTLPEYRTRSTTARAAAQLEAYEKYTRPGQMVRFLYTRNKDGVHAWNLPSKPDPAGIDTERYITLLLRAACTVLQPLDIDDETLRLYLDGYSMPALFDRQKLLLHR